MSSAPAFGPSCPSGGTWYACAGGTNFVGCCARDPCSVRCPQGDLYPAGFDKTKHGTFPDASCQQGGALFYTCTAGNTFLGCCKSNPCSNGGVCPRADLDPAFLYAEDTRRAYGATGGSSSVSSRLSASATASSTLSTATQTPAAEHKSGPPVAAIAGGAAGGAFALAVIVVLIIYYCCHAKKSRKGHEESLSRRQSDLPNMAAVHETTKGSHAPDAPPGYSSPHPTQYYDPHTGHYVGYAHHHNHQYTPEPQELPIEPVHSANFSRKQTASHRRNLSELSGDTAVRPELESPYTTPKVQQDQFSTPISSPMMQHNYDQRVQGSEPSSPAMRNWSTQQTWTTPTIPEHVPASRQGLGVQGPHTEEDVQQRGNLHAQHYGVYSRN